MGTPDRFKPFEYPDSAGYPDGTGTLDEGAKALLEDETKDALRSVDRPSVDADTEITVHHDQNTHIYTAMTRGRELASLRYREVAGRIVVLTTTVNPEFRGRGIATELIASALDDIRKRGMLVSVYCPLVASFMNGNQQYADLVDPAHPGR